MSSITASVVVSTKDRNSRLRLVLLSLEQQMRSDIEVVIVFDGCKLETLQEFEKFKFSFDPIKVISEKNVKYSAARNLGVRNASGEIIIFIDDDRIPGPDCIAKHIAGHKKKCVLYGERAEIELAEQEIIRLGSGNNFLDKFKSIQKDAKKAVDTPNTIMRRLFYNTRLPLKWMVFYTGNISVPKAELIKAGLFDEKMVTWGGEDIDLGYRLYKLNIPFKKDFSIVNYHLVHDHHIMKKMLDSRSNTCYLKQKYKGEVIAQTGILIMFFFLYYWKLKWKLMTKLKKGDV